MIRMLSLATFGLLVAGPATAQMTWAVAPTAAALAAAYPARAKAEGVGGAADLVCTVGRGGRMTDCAILGESPRGLGFGAAARQLAREMRSVGVPAGTELRFPITFAAEAARGAPYTAKTPQWSALPSVSDMQAAAPKTEGGPNDVRVTLVCDVQVGGSLSGCAVDREEPAGQGFGPAILGLAPKFRVELMTVEGMPTVGAKVRVPVRFALKPVEQAAVK